MLPSCDACGAAGRDLHWFWQCPDSVSLQEFVRSPGNFARSYCAAQHLTFLHQTTGEEQPNLALILSELGYDSVPARRARALAAPAAPAAEPLAAPAAPPAAEPRAAPAAPAAEPAARVPLWRPEDFDKWLVKQVRLGKADNVLSCFGQGPRQTSSGQPINCEWALKLVPALQSCQLLQAITCADEKGLTEAAFQDDYGCTLWLHAKTLWNDTA